jgi:hypothetical protein
MASVLFISKFQSLVHRKQKFTKEIDNIVFGKKIGFITRLIGCNHGNLSRPFSQNKTFYRSCLNCGARRQFNSDTMETHGNFYFPPVIKIEQN